MVKKDKKQEILQHGFEVMYAKGYHATSIQDIADAAHMPKGSFYHYFKTKELFTVDAISLYTDMVYSEMEYTLTDMSLTPLKRILTLYQNRIDYYESKQYMFGCFAGNLTNEISDSNDVLRIAVNTFFDKNRTLLVACLEEAQNSDELDETHNTEDLAEFIVSSYEGVLLRMKSVRNPKPLEVFQKYLENLLT
ncbi:MAG: TetR family transcriptional regulator C-terminal domain-containing protein [Chloroflexota bacterium]